MNGFLGRVILHIEHKLQLIIYIGGKRSGSKFHLKREFYINYVSAYKQQIVHFQFEIKNIHKSKTSK